MKEMTFEGFEINSFVFVMFDNGIRKFRVDGITLQYAARLKVKYYTLKTNDGNQAYYPDFVFGSESDLVKGLIGGVRI